MQENLDKKVIVSYKDELLDVTKFSEFHPGNYFVQ